MRPEEKYTILVVDDEPGIRMTLSDILEWAGYRVLLADCGEAAMRIVEDQPVDLVCLDFRMPGLNGFEAFKQMVKAQPKLLAIFVTAYFDDELLKNLRCKKIYGVMQKPLDIPLFLGNIKRALEPWPQPLAEARDEAATGPDNGIMGL